MINEDDLREKKKVTNKKAHLNEIFIRAIHLKSPNSEKKIFAGQFVI